MARAYDLERADTARPGKKDQTERQAQRRRRNTVMGPGSGADFGDGAIVPATMAAITIPDQDVTSAFRAIREMSKSTDERIELLTIILGE